MSTPTPPSASPVTSTARPSSWRPASTASTCWSAPCSCWSAWSAPMPATSRRSSISASNSPRGTGTSSTWCGCSCSSASMSGSAAPKPWPTARFELDRFARGGRRATLFVSRRGRPNGCRTRLPARFSKVRCAGLPCKMPALWQGMANPNVDGPVQVIRLIQKWLKAGVLEDGIVTVSDKGTGQGSVISPLLANLYLHYAFDLWAERWRRREAAGNMIIVRYADDLIVGFEHETDARRFLDEMRKRLQEFALSLHSEKTRLIEFGRFAVENRRRRGLGKPETVTFLGFTFICSKTRRGKFQIKRKSRRDRMQAKLRAIKQELRRSMHQPIPQQGRWLQQVVTGYFNYHAVPTNSSTLTAFLFH